MWKYCIFVWRRKKVGWVNGPPCQKNNAQVGGVDRPHKVRSAKKSLSFFWWPGAFNHSCLNSTALNCLHHSSLAFREKGNLKKNHMHLSQKKESTQPGHNISTSLTVQMHWIACGCVYLLWQVRKRATPQMTGKQMNIFSLAWVLLN